MLVRRLRWLTAASLHSYERASYLRSLLLLDPRLSAALLPMHLLDCEPQVRLLAAQYTPLTDDAHRWLTELRNDAIEEEEIRSAAAERLNASWPARSEGRRASHATNRHCLKPMVAGDDVGAD